MVTDNEEEAYSMVVPFRRIFFVILIFTVVVNHAFSMTESANQNGYELVQADEPQTPSLIAQLYCSVLGNEDARTEYRVLVYQALKDLGIEKPSAVSVKQMNGIGPAFARVPLSTFTAFGIWLDEPYLDSCSFAEKIFHLYHEAAHYTLMHHQKILAGVGISLLLVSLGVIELSGILRDVSVLMKNIVAVGTGAFIVAGCYRYILPHFIKRQEKQADILAAQTLIAHGKKDIVIEHIDNLSKMPIIEEDALWWYSNVEQATYLKAILCGKS